MFSFIQLFVIDLRRGLKQQKSTSIWPKTPVCRLHCAIYLNDIGIYRRLQIFFCSFNYDNYRIAEVCSCIFYLKLKARTCMLKWKLSEINGLYRRLTHRLHFSWIVPHVDVGVLQGLVHRYSFSRVDNQHLRQQVSGLAGCGLGRSKKKKE